MVSVLSAIGFCAGFLLCNPGATPAMAASTATTTPAASSAQESTPASRFAGALEHPDRLKPLDDFTTLRWTNPGVDYRKFSGILIERVGVKTDSHSPPIDPIFESGIAPRPE